MAKLRIRCPICSKWEQIEIADDATKNVSKGLLAINIAAGMICEHSFIAYVDKNLTVRDCLVADFKIELPESTAPDQPIKPETETIKFDLIRLNIPELLMVNVIKTIFLGKKVIIISDQEFLYNHIINFFKAIMDNIFEFDLVILSEEEYKSKENNYKDRLVFKNREIIRDNEKIINPKKLDFEKEMVHKFLSEYDLMAGVIILRNEIKKAYEFSNTIAELIQQKEGKGLTSKVIIEYISEKHDEKINKSYLSFLIDIVKNYFKIDVPSISGVTDLLRLL
ncbi:MAG: hypothetical protein ACFFDY_04535 [Candidatus Thorarchaeota archaeon]